MNSFSNYNRIWDHMLVSYYPTAEEKKCCGNKPTLGALMAYLHPNRSMDLNVFCFGGKNFDLTNVPFINTVITEIGHKPQGVWDFTEEYKKDYKNSKTLHEFLNS